MIDCSATHCLYHMRGRCRARAARVLGGTCREKGYAHCQTYLDSRNGAMAYEAAALMEIPFPGLEMMISGQEAETQPACDAVNCVYQRNGQCYAPQLHIAQGTDSFPAICETFWPLY